MGYTHPGKDSYWLVATSPRGGVEYIHAGHTSGINMWESFEWGGGYDK
jgi:hypothetical protein